MQQIRRLVGAVVIVVTLLLTVVGWVYWDELRAKPKLFAWLWTIALLGAWLSIMLAVWDAFDVARQSRAARRKLTEEHFADKEFLSQLRDKAAEKGRDGEERK